MSIITIINNTHITSGDLMRKSINLEERTIDVLIVEDETVLALGMEASLEDLNYNVCAIAVSADMALNYTKEYVPDIVIMDINLKGKKSGIQAAKEIWENYQIPIVFLTSYTDDVTLQNAMKSEPYAYLTKPCRDKDLEIAIKTALHKHKCFFQNKEFFPQDSIISLVKDYTFCKNKRILYKKELALKLTGNEIKFFEILSLKVGESVSFERIISFIYTDEYSDISKLRTLVYRLKAKLEDVIFENVYEFGYRLKIA